MLRTSEPSLKKMKSISFKYFLWRVFKKKWNKFRQNEIDKAINQFRSRLRDVIDVGGKQIEQYL